MKATTPIVGYPIGNRLFAATLRVLADAFVALSEIEVEAERAAAAPNHADAHPDDVREYERGIRSVIVAGGDVETILMKTLLRRFGRIGPDQNVGDVRDGRWQGCGYDLGDTVLTVVPDMNGYPVFACIDVAGSWHSKDFD